MRTTNAQDQSEANEYESHDRDDLYDGEPVFKFTKAVDTHAIDSDQTYRDSNDPNPLRNAREPNGKVNCNRRDLRTDGQDLNEGVGNANREPRPLIQVCLRIDTE